MPEDLHPRHLGRRLVQLALVMALVVGVVVAVPGLAAVRHRLAHASAGWLALALAAELGSVLSYVAIFRGVFCRRMRWGLALRVGLAEQGANSLLPAGGAGGLALGAWALHQGGMSSEHIARRTVAFFMLTSAANFLLVILAGIGLAAGLLPGQASLALTVGPAVLAAAAVVLVAALPRLFVRLPDHPPMPERPGRGARLRHRLDVGLRAVGLGVSDAGALLREGRPTVILGGLGNVVFDIAALAAAFRAFGHVPPLGVFLLAYLVGQLGGLIPVPGGIGGTGGGLIGAYILYGTSAAAATAAVLPYRVLQVWLPAILGVPAFVALRRTLGREPSPASLFAPLAETGTRELQPTSRRAVGRP